MILLKTSHGDITLKLDHERAPKTAANFEAYVRDGFYDGLIFHRVIHNFMIQTGGFEPGMVPRRTGEPIENEADNGLSNMKGTVAMARTMNPHSATAQFFINVENNGFLDHSAKTAEGWGYAVFGEVVEGMDVVNRIRAVPTTFREGHQDVPAEDIVLEKADVLDEGGSA
ncbi:peptidyl-prolyl cis-trans isomerase B (cyclophilin B) [Tamilnaduibacter salinus]|uniref:Peptidyl-prolyl cis-trans isomerase n=1 Tax=Tamilnaduibacter salinus TaxID=1484056 RepID=A0A2U1CV45_9GAMM|nr:peptidylprolyl isomerase [Tamilnaduibacter salinus]PVY75395.1 peptidyl-prolyl cis-trans isomerase B (cyclophilin B) [Tamilnaduibacter salinus]